METSAPGGHFVKDLSGQSGKFTEFKREASEASGVSLQSGAGPGGDEASGKWLLPVQQGSLASEQRSGPGQGRCSQNPLQGLGPERITRQVRKSCFLGDGS